MNTKAKQMKCYYRGRKKMKKEYEKVLQQYHALEYDDRNDTSENEKADLGKDLFKQLKRVSIPILDGEAKYYENWKSHGMRR